MKEHPALDQLSQFYQSLDDIPTPAISLPTERGLPLWALFTGPIFASILAYSVLVISTAGHAMPTEPQGPILLNQYALQELRKGDTSSVPASHIFVITSRGRVI